MTRVMLSALWLVVASSVSWAQEPPSAPPAEWGPMSINLEDVPYPHQV